MAMTTFRRGHWTKKTELHNTHLRTQLKRHIPEINPGLSEALVRHRTIIHLISRDGDKCYLCGRRNDGPEYEIEHIIPRSLGGSDHLSNLALACSSCNMHKHASIVSMRISDHMPCFWRAP